MNIKQVLDEMFSKPSALGNINYQIKHPMLLSEGMAQVYRMGTPSVYLLLEHQESKSGMCL
ncbi:MAG: hypothetical protein IPP76_12025 [Moraxellaceae bacterium]|nr:hypothetical protein [Moraxellaceae bacterium]